MKKSLSILFLFICSQVLFSQKISREEYINTYQKIAKDKMREFGIPASITLAQGVLESGSGNSTLARKANNHFGIKCHSNWKGKKVYHDDDKKNECFRKYKTAEESYYDHSVFLTSASRYDFLFELKPDDYKGWARGLKKAGYATSKTYATALIRIIEENELYKLDEEVLKGEPKKSTKKKIDSAEKIAGRKILTNNDINYITVKPGDNLDKITQQLGLFTWEIPKYNEFYERGSSAIEVGQVLYIQPKRGKAEHTYKTHTVQQGESLYTISQTYGIKLSKLRKLNRLDEADTIEKGMVLNLRKRVKQKPGIAAPKVQVKDIIQPKGDEPIEKEQKVEVIFDPD